MRERRKNSQKNSERIENIHKAKKKVSPKTKFKPRFYSEKVLASHSLKYDKYKRFWIYDNDAGIWKNGAEVRLNSILRKEILGSDDYKRYCVGEILEDLKGLTLVNGQLEEPPAHLIPFQNKIYDLDSGKLLDYHPDHFFINKLPVEINTRNRKCPTIERILRELVKPENLITLYEILGYVLYRDYPYPKVSILYGKGGNGKTTYIRMMERLIGVENISSVSIDDLQYNRFASSELFGKLANVSGEMDYNVLKKTSRLKQCCGQDLMRCERKFRETFPFRNHAKMIYLTNEVPPTEDKTGAFYRRMFLVKFPNKFIMGKNADPMVVEKISQEEFEGLAWKCLKVLKKLRKRDFVFSRHQATQDVAKQYEELSNPLDEFLAENTKRDVNSHIPVGEFNEKYQTCLAKNGFRMWTVKMIGKAMKEKGVEQRTLCARNPQDKKRTHTYRAWCGVKWK